MPSDSDRPLTGIRVIDHADHGELCGRLLADLGAGVIRIESPGGAASRGLPPFHGDTSLYFTVRNLGKKSVTLDRHGRPYALDPRGSLANFLAEQGVFVLTRCNS